MYTRKVLILLGFVMAVAYGVLTFAEDGIDCPPWSCGANGPALTGVHSEADREDILSPVVYGGNECPSWSCGANGPALTGTRAP